MYKIKFIKGESRLKNRVYAGKTGLITIFSNWHGFRLVAKVYIPTLCKQIPALFFGEERFKKES
ncbi:MAG: hypothetical protein ACI8YQ_002849 [Polaribacter sp.]|jgi:hypothetical protein